MVCKSQIDYLSSEALSLSDHNSDLGKDIKMVDKEINKVSLIEENPLIGQSFGRNEA